MEEWVQKVCKNNSLVLDEWVQRVFEPILPLKQRIFARFFLKSAKKRSYKKSIDS